jgi:DNA topoisomerase IA
MDPRHIINASRNLINLDQKQVNAVASRIELDLRIGYAFTRFLTTSLRTLGGPFQNLLLSYGISCTLDFGKCHSFTYPVWQDPASFQPWGLL